MPSIDLAPTTKAATTQTKVFLSYSRRDGDFVSQLALALADHGIHVFRDTDDILPTEDWKNRLQSLIGQSDTIVFCLSPRSITSEICSWEAQHASELNKRLLPIVIEECHQSVVPTQLARLNYINFSENFDLGLDTLLAALSTDITWIRRQTWFGELARQWELNARPEDRLMRGVDVTAGETWVAQRPPGAPEPDRNTLAFIAASRFAENARGRFRRRLQAFIAVLALGVIVGLVYATQANRTILSAHMRLIVDDWWPMSLRSKDEVKLKAGDNFQECADCPKMVIIKAGSFEMGSDSNPTEQPRHRVVITKSFAVSMYLITFAQWDACMARGGCSHYADDRGWGRGLMPVTDISWNDAQEYVKWLRRQTGRPYRLLSESEWEYSARAGSTTIYPWGDDPSGGHADCHACGSKWDDKQPAPVGSFPPNGFGLYDMIGNLWEWVEDSWHMNYQGAPRDGSVWAGGDESQRVTRGGSYGQTSGEDTSTYRNFAREPDFRNYIFGIRVARDLSHAE